MEETEKTWLDLYRENPTLTLEQARQQGLVDLVFTTKE